MREREGEGGRKGTVALDVGRRMLAERTVCDIKYLNEVLCDYVSYGFRFCMSRGLADLWEIELHYGGDDIERILAQTKLRDLSEENSRLQTPQEPRELSSSSIQDYDHKLR